MSHRSPTPAIRNSVPFDDAISGLPADAQRRLNLFLAAAKAAAHQDFRGAVLLSLIVYVDDDVLAEAIDDALHSTSGVPGGAA